MAPSPEGDHLAPRRRPARRRTRSGGGGVLLGGFVGIVALSVLFEYAITYPVFGVLLLVGVTTTVVLIVRHRAVRRRQVAAFEAQQRDLAMRRSMEVAPYHAMNANQFEQALALLCERDGCTNVRVVGGAGDLGADVIATAPDGRRLVVQAKRYGPTTKVTGPDLQRFGGTCYNVHGAQVAAVVTTSVFTKQAVTYAAHMNIGLFDGDALAGWASRTGPAPWH
jgi:restriction system protein